MAQKFTVPVTIKNLSSAGSDGITVFLDQESFARLKVEAGGRITWGAGAGAGDTNLYRDEANVLKTDDTFKSAGLFVTGTQIDPTGATVGDALVFNGTKFVSASVAGGGASLTVSDTPPVGAEEGDLWFSSLELEVYVYYSSSWIQVTDSNSGVQELYELVDVLIDNPISGEALVYNGTEWVNGLVSAGAASSLQTARVISLSGDVSGSVSFDGSQNVSIAATIQPNSVALGTDTTGNYVNDLTAGTGVTVTHTPGEGTSPTVAIGQAVGTSASVTFAAVTAPVIGNASTASALETTRTISLTGDVSGSVSFNGSADASISATIQPNSVSLGTDTTGNYVNDLTAGTGVTVTHTPGEGTSPTVAIGQAVGTSASVTFAAVTAPLIGNASTATALQTARNIAGQSFDGSANISIAPTDLTGVTSSAAELNILDGATLSTTELNYVDGVTSAIQTQIDTKAPSASPTFTGVVTLPDNTVALGTKTTGDYVASLVAGTGVTLTNNSGETATPTVAIGQAVGTSASVTFASLTVSGQTEVGGHILPNANETYDLGSPSNRFRDIYLSGSTMYLGEAEITSDGTSINFGSLGTSGDLTVGGNLTVNGTTTTLNTETLSIEDNIIVLNSNVSASPILNAGIEVERGTSANVAVRWNESSDKWQITNDGSTYEDIATTADVAATSIAGLDDIGDVSASAPSVGEVLQWNGTAWVPSLVVGPEGPPGAPGAPGAAGEHGMNGAAGVNGAPGADGSDGADGNDGNDGLGYPALQTPATQYYDTDTTFGSTGFTIDITGTAYIVGNRVRLVWDTSPDTYYEGNITAFDLISTTLTVDVDLAVGATGAKDVFNLALTGEPGPLETVGFSFSSNTANSASVAVTSVTVDPYGRVTAVSANGYQYADTSNAGVVRIDGNDFLMDAGTLSIKTGAIYDGDVNASAGIALSKLATGTAGNIPVYNGSGVLTSTGSPAAATTSTGASGFGYMGLPQNGATTGAYGVVGADAGTHIYSSATRTVTIPANATIAMPVGSTVVFIAGPGATVTIAITSDTMYLAGLGTTGSRTLAPFGMATAVKITSTSWIISGNGLT